MFDTDGRSCVKDVQLPCQQRMRPGLCKLTTWSDWGECLGTYESALHSGFCWEWQDTRHEFDSRCAGHVWSFGVAEMGCYTSMGFDITLLEMFDLAQNENILNAYIKYLLLLEFPVPGIVCTVSDFDPGIASHQYRSFISPDASWYLIPWWRSKIHPKPRKIEGKSGKGEKTKWQNDSQLFSTSDPGSSECDGSKVRNRSIVEYMKKTCHVRIPRMS